MNDEEVCLNCKYFDTSNNFCRLNPPTPITFYDDMNKRVVITSKYPVISKPNIDYCSYFEDVNYNE